MSQEAPSLGTITCSSQILTHGGGAVGTRPVLGAPIPSITNLPYLIGMCPLHTHSNAGDLCVKCKGTFF